MERETTDWRQVALLWCTGLLAAAQFGKLTLTLPLMQAHYPQAGLGVPLLVSLVGVLGILLGPVAGVLVTRLGVRRAVLGAMALGAAMSLVQALLLPMPLMVASRILEGGSHLTLVVALPTLMAETANARDKPVVMGLWGTYFGVTFALLALVLPLLAGLGGLPLIFALHGGALLAMALVMAGLLPRGRATLTLLHLWAELRAIYASPRAMAPGLIFVWHALAFIALLAFLPAALGGAPWVAVALPLVSLAGTFSAGFLARRFAPAWLAAGAFALNLALCLLILVLPALGVPLALVMFFSMGLVAGAGFAAIPWLNPDLASRARANGALAQLGNVGTFSGTPLMALTGGTLAGVIGVSTAIALSGLVLSVWVGLRFRRGRA